MKKKFAVIGCLVAMSTLLFTGCGNKDMFDTVYTFNRAIIKLPDGTIVSGEVDSWADYEGEQLQIKIDGTTYLVHSENATLIVDAK